MDDRPLCIGDRIESTRAGRTRYEVIGWTARGKVRLRREATDTELTTWWSTVGTLPKGYRLYRAVEPEREAA